MNGVGEASDVDDTVGPARAAYSDLAYTRADRRHRPPLTRICALLHLVEFMAGLPAHAIGKTAQSIERVPVKRHRLERHNELYHYLYKRQAAASSERPAQKFRSSQPIAPRLVRRLGDADPGAAHDLDGRFALAQRERRPVEGKPV